MGSCILTRSAIGFLTQASPFLSFVRTSLKGSRQTYSFFDWDARRQSGLPTQLLVLYQ